MSRPPNKYCNLCGHKMIPEWDADVEQYIWYCPCCGVTKTESEE